MADKKRFLKKHRSKIIQKTRNPIKLADDLLAEGCISKEIYNNIRTQSTKQDKTREIFDCFNSIKHFECTYDWLKKNESELCAELEKEAAAPKKKRARLETEDEADNNAGFPDLKITSTFGKLEHWASTPENSQQLISYLERKLGDGGMATLENELKNKEPKKTLCFNASNIDEIRKNGNLETFLSEETGVQFPSLALSMFFKKGDSASSGNKAQSSTDYSESVDTTANLNSSGYESLVSPSLNDSFSPCSLDCLGQNNKRLPDEDVLPECSPTGDMDFMNHENTTEQLHGGSFGQMHCEAKADPPLQEPMDMQDTQSDEFEEQSQRSNAPNVPVHEDGPLHQTEPITKKEKQLKDGAGSMDVQDTHTDEMEEQSQRSHFPTFEDGSPHQNQSITKNETALDGAGSMDVQDTCFAEIDDESQRSNAPNVPVHEDGSPHQTEPITKKETPLKDGAGSMDAQDTHTNEMEEQSQRSHFPTFEDGSPHQNQSITKKETPLDGHGNMDVQDMCFAEIDNKSQRSNAPNVPVHEDGSPHQTEPITKKDTPLKDLHGSMDVQDTCFDEIDDESQRTNAPNFPTHEDGSLHQTEPIIKKETPLKDGHGSMDVQDTHTNEMEEQSQISNIPTFEGGSPHQNQSITKKETPLDGAGSMDVQDTCFDEIDNESQRSNSPNAPSHGDGSPHQTESISKKEKQLKDGIGSTEMKEMHIDKMDEEPQESNVAIYADSIIKNKMPLEDRCGNMTMPQNGQGNTQVNPEPFSSKQQQKNSPGSASEYTQSHGTQMKNTATPLRNRGVKDQVEAAKKREVSKKLKEKKKKEKDQLLFDWAEKQCNDCGDEIKNIFDQISIIDMAEHREYPFFTAENVMVYKHLSPERKIIFIADDKTSKITTTTTVQYHMYVCDIKKAILLGPKKTNTKEIEYDESKVPIGKCKKFIGKVLAPALAVYKKIQKEEKLYSLIQVQ